MENIENTFGEYLISTDQQKLDLPAIHDFLSKHAGWCDGIPLHIVKTSIENALCFGIYHQGQQIGFAKIISDFATVAYLGDVYILEPHRGQGLSKNLMDMIMAHPHLQGLRRWILRTSTADWLYQKYGFTRLSHPEIFMERYEPQVY